MLRRYSSVLRHCQSFEKLIDHWLSVATKLSGRYQNQTWSTRRWHAAHKGLGDGGDITAIRKGADIFLALALQSLRQYPHRRKLIWMSTALSLAALRVPSSHFAQL